MGVLNELTMLQEIGCTDIERYTLVNNYGYTFTKGGIQYDLRYWNNCYGVYGGGWSVNATDVRNQPTRCPSFDNDFDGVVEWIENNL